MRHSSTETDLTPERRKEKRTPRTRTGASGATHSAGAVSQRKAKENVNHGTENAEIRKPEAGVNVKPGKQGKTQPTGQRS